MSNPSQILSQIRQRRSQPAPVNAGRVCPAPAPAPMKREGAPASPPAERAAPDAPPFIAPGPAPAEPTERRAAPRPARGHGLYSQVMRSHDRMKTRHLPS